MSAIQQATEAGQSLWLHYLRRAFIESRQLRELLDEGLRGVVVDPAVIEEAVAASREYNQPLQQLASQGVPLKDMAQALLIDDVQRAADTLQTVYRDSEHQDGFVTVPFDPTLAHNRVALLAQGQKMDGIGSPVDRPNIMIELPATQAGLLALRRLVADGCDVMVSHIFSLASYEQVAEAYLDGLEEFLESHSVWRSSVASVAAISMASIDCEVDAVLGNLGRPELQGRAALSLARLLYERFQQLFSGPRWQRLVRKGGTVQRLLWMDTVPRNYAYPATYYVDALIGPDTVHALAPPTINAFRERGEVAATLTEGLAEAREYLAELQELGIDLDGRGPKLQEQCLETGRRTYQQLTRSIAHKRDELESGWHRLQGQLGERQRLVDNALAEMCEERVMCRLWLHDATLWPKEGQAVAAQSGWMHLLPVMVANRNHLEAGVEAAHQDGYREAVVVSGGAPLLVATLFKQTFGALPYIPGVIPYAAGPHLRLSIEDAGREAGREQRLDALADYDRLFVFTATAEDAAANEAFTDFYACLAEKKGSDRAREQVIAVAPPGSALARLARAAGVRALFLDTPQLQGGYSALSYNGLLPAALTGLDLTKLLHRASYMAANASGCNCPLHGDNMAAQLGTIIALLGRQKVIFVSSPFLESFIVWAQALLGASTGLQSERLIGQPPEATGLTGEDPLFIYLRLDGDVSQDEMVAQLARSHPVVTLRLQDLYDLGGQLFLWQMATVVAAYHLGRNPYAVAEAGPLVERTRAPRTRLAEPTR